MPLYSWGEDNLEAVPPTTFEAAESIAGGSICERLIRDQPEVLGRGLIHCRRGIWELGGFVNRSIDLLALDASRDGS